MVFSVKACELIREIPEGNLGRMLQILAEEAGVEVYLVEPVAGVIAQTSANPLCDEMYAQAVTVMFRPLINAQLDKEDYFSSFPAQPDCSAMVVAVGFLYAIQESLFELGAVAIGAALRFQAAANTRQRALAQNALKSLSYSEMAATRMAFEELDDDEGIIVASRVTDKLGLTRSLFVTAFGKLASAGVAESHSLGMKGTYIKVRNPFFLEELRKEMA